METKGKGREGRRGRRSNRLVWLSWDSRTPSAARMGAGHQGVLTAMLRITGPSDSLVPQKTSTDQTQWRMLCLLFNDRHVGIIHFRDG